MKRPDTIMIGGRAYSWRVLSALRKKQLEEWQAAQSEQQTLFALREDRRPATERTASQRWQEPSLMDWQKADSNRHGKG
jgi:hypothetical protein